MVIEDVRKTVEATLGQLTPAKAQQLAKDMMEPGAAKEQIAKTAADLVEWSQSNKERLRTFVRREISAQVKSVGVASQSDLDALKKRVRDLERGAGMTASGRTAARKKSTSRKKSTASPTTSTRSAESGSTTSG